MTSDYIDEVILRAEHLSRRFGSGQTEVVAVNEVTLEVRRGEIVLIMGPSGSGKTTLLSMLGGLLRPTAGRITVNGTEITALSEAELPDVRLRRFGFVFQDFNLLSALTVVENVEVALNLAGVNGREARARAEEVLIDLGLGHRLNFRPHKLSGGEKQRVAIARALTNEPAVILADEPTANLDSKIGQEIVRLLRQIAKEQNRSVVIVSHDQRLREIADRVLWLEDGRFKEIGQLVEDPVCGMKLEREKAPASIRVGETEYFFCSRGCRWEFEESPEKFVGMVVHS